MKISVALSCIAALVWCVPAWSGVPRDAGLPSGGDDAPRLQAILDQGDIIALRPGMRYRISTGLELRNGGGIVTAGAAATIVMSATFSNMDPRAPMAQANRTGIRAASGLAHDLQLRNFKLEKEHVDGSYVAAIWLQGAERSILEGVEMSGFSLGGILAIDSVTDLVVRACTIRDSWASQVSAEPSHRYLPQLTGINVDDNRLRNAAGIIDSSRVLIAHNTISDLRFKKSLYEMQRTSFLGFEGQKVSVGYETDAINLQNKPHGVKIVGNVLSGVGEGVDSFGYDVTIEQNLIQDVFLFGVKLIHGASDNVVRNNVIRRAGLSAVVVAGSNLDQAGDSFGNTFAGNAISEIGSCNAFCTGSAPPDFAVVNAHPTDWPGAFAVWGSHAFQQHPRDNLFYENEVIVRDGDRAKLMLEFVGPVGHHYFLRNVLTNSSGRTFQASCVDAGAADLCNDIDSSAVSELHLDDPSVASGVVAGDFDGNGKQDTFAYWAGPGLNRLYYKSTMRSLIVSENSIAPEAINGWATHVRAGDFNGDGREDLIFYWRTDGTNRLFYGKASGGFDFVNNPIAPNVLAGYASSVEVGDFNGDGRDDLFFVDSAAGRNITYLGSASGFAGSLTPILPTSVSGYPDDLLAGDFDGDGKTDLAFLWRGSGLNRFFFGGTGSYTAQAEPIDPTAINGYADKVWVDDFDMDGRDDVSFFWHGTGTTRRVFFGAGNRSFSMR